MAVNPAGVENNLLLNAWQRIMWENIWTFNQIAGEGAPLNENCDVYIQPERDQIARALDSSIKKVARLLRYWPRPRWFQNSILFGGGLPYRLQWLQTHTPEQDGSWKLIELGQRATTLIDDAVVVNYSDVGGYGINNTATITVAAGALTNTDEIQVFFRVADGAVSAGSARYQIEPAQVTLSGGSFIITVDRSLMVKPSVWATPYVVTDPNRNERNIVDNANASTGFVNAVDVYRVYNDTTTQLEVLDWNNTVLDTFDGVVVDSELGLFAFQQACEPDLWCFCNRPVRVRVNYRAGLPLIDGYMDSELEEAIIRMANVLMPVELCTFCAPTKNAWAQDRQPAVRDRVSLLEMNHQRNPWGYDSYGAVYAYRTAADRAIATGGKITRRVAR